MAQEQTTIACTTHGGHTLTEDQETLLAVLTDTVAPVLARLADATEARLIATGLPPHAANDAVLGAVQDLIEEGWGAYLRRVTGSSIP